MRALIQLVSKASLNINDELFSSIDRGLLVLLGVTHDDKQEDIEWIWKKIENLRIFSDGEKMNFSVKDIDGQILIVSQFTLMGNVKKGNRPSYIRAAKPEIAKVIYDQFVDYARKQSNLKIETGQFQAQMKISLINDGPVTIILDSKQKDL